MTMFQTLRRMMGAGATLKIQCEACGHRTEWTRQEAFARLGPDAAPSDIRRKLSCQACGGKECARAWI